MPRFRRVLAFVAVSFFAAGGLILAPTPAQAATNVQPMPSAMGLPLSIGAAYDLISYRLSSMAPSLADLKRYNPTLSEDDVKRMYRTSSQQWDMQRQETVIAEQSRVGRMQAADGKWTLKNAVAQAQGGTAPNTPPGGQVSPATTKLKEKIATQQQKYRVPTIKPATLLRGAGATAVGYLAYDVAMDLVDQGFKASGINVDGLVCTSPGAPLLDILTTADCGAYGEYLESFVANQDAAGGVSSRPCNAAGDCLQLTALYLEGYTSYDGVKSDLACWSGPVGFSMYTWYADGTGETRMTQETARAGCTADFTSLNMSKRRAAYGEIVGFSSLDAGATVSPVTTLSADPERTIECSVLATDGATYSSSTAGFKQSEGQPDAVCPPLPEGVFPENIKLTEKGGDAPVVLADKPTSEQFKEKVANSPDCLNGLCTLELFQVESDTSCFQLDEACKDWFKDPQKATKYACEYGGAVQSIDRCNVYRQVFDPKFRAQGFAYSDPLTGETLVTPTTKTQAEAAMGSSASVQDCMNQAVSTGDMWNVIFSPVRCAWVWAMIPQPLTVDKAMADTMDSYQGTPLGKIGTIVSSWNPAVTLTGCDGPPISIHIDKPGAEFAYDGNPINACPGEMLSKFVQPVKVFGSAFMVIGGCLTIVNIIASATGMRKVATMGGDSA